MSASRPTRPFADDFSDAFGPVTEATTTVPVYCSVEDLAAVVGGPQGAQERLTTAVILGSRYVDHIVGITPSEAVLAPPYALTVVPCEPAYRQAAIAAAARFLKSPDLPFGAVGGLGDMAVYVKGVSVPEVDLLLVGHRTKWGIA
jgi:hypothetical protein